MIKYQATPLDILLVQQDGWNGENKVGCVRFTSPPALAFLLSTFSPSAKKCVLGQTWWISVRKKKEEKKEDFTALRRKHIFLCLVPDAPVLPSLCVSALPPSLPLSFLLFYLRSLSEGLTISSSVSPLSCSAVYCLWFARAHPCGCSFRQPSVTRSNWGVGGWGGSTPLPSPPLGHTRSSLTWDGPRTHTLITWLCRGWWNLNPCLAAGVSWAFVQKKGVRAIETLHERKRGERSASSLFSEV